MPLPGEQHMMPSCRLLSNEQEHSLERTRANLKRMLNHLQLHTAEHAKNTYPQFFFESQTGGHSKTK